MILRQKLYREAFSLQNRVHKVNIHSKISSSLSLSSSFSTIANKDHLQVLEKSFSSFSFPQLVCEYFILNLSSSSLIIQVINKILASKSFSSSPFLSLFKSPTSSFLYSRFCGGKNQATAIEACKKALSEGVLPVIDKSNEDGLSEKELDDNLADKIELLHNVEHLCPSIPIKLTSLIPFQLLERMTALIYNEESKAGLSSSLASFYTDPLIITNQLNTNEQELLTKYLKNLERLCDQAKEKQVGLWLDAEQTSRQPAVEFIYRYLALKYNKIPPNSSEGQLPLVYNTYQCYLKRSNRAVYQDLHFSIQNNLVFGVKLVRGAYMTAERKAETDSVQVSKDHTDNNYNNLLTSLFPFVHKNISFPPFKTIQKSNSSKNIFLKSSFFTNLNQKEEIFNPNFNSLLSSEYSSVCLLICTHNHSSVLHALNLMSQYKVSPKSFSVQFCQIQGLCKSLSLFLRAEGYLSSKLFLYGEPEHLNPWFIRRLEEHKDSLGALKVEEKILKQEILSRISLQ